MTELARTLLFSFYIGLILVLIYVVFRYSFPVVFSASRIQSMMTSLLDMATTFITKLTESGVVDFRASIFIPNYRRNTLRMVFYSSDFIGKKDQGISFGFNQGIVGAAIRSRKALTNKIPIELIEIAKTWKLNSNQIKKTKGLSCIMAIPILNPEDKENDIIAVLAIDSKNKLAYQILDDNETKQQINVFVDLISDLLSASGFIPQRNCWKQLAHELKIDYNKGLSLLGIKNRKQ